MMVKFQVVFSEQSRSQMKDIALYLQQTVSTEHAVKITKSLQEFSDSLEMMPERFALARNIVLRRQGYRCGVCCDKYLVLYKVNGEKKEVQIFAIVNGTRDYVNLVF